MFIPTPNKEHPAKHLQDILLYDRKLRLKYYFHQDTTTETTELTEDDNTHNDILHPSSGLTPPSGQEPFSESYRSTIIHNTMKEIKGRIAENLKEIRRKKNGKLLPHSEIIDIVIKPADKGGNIVIMNKQDYLQEGLKQLSNSTHYEILDKDPTQEYNNQIYQVLQQAANLNIIDDRSKKTLYNIMYNHCIPTYPTLRAYKP